tara:strand:- start:1276 stop:2262 length:987 start_codon:yes stop_codon:yes gene_type:complete
MKIKMSYAEAILSGFEYVLDTYPECFVLGQGLWSPWYVGNTMKNLDQKYGKDRIIDTPVSESAVTGMAVGASLVGGRPIVVHPRIDFMLYAMDTIVNQAAKWSYMTGGQANPSLVIRGIINRGGEQGAQHSQSLHSWFAHIPGLRVVMPYSVQDARDLFIASVLSKDPVVFIDDRWLYENQDSIELRDAKDINSFEPKIIKLGTDLTIIGTSYSVDLALQVEKFLKKDDINAEVIDIRVINPLKVERILESVKKTNKLCVIDGGWKNSGFSAEIVARIVENLDPLHLKSKPLRITLKDSPAPTPTNLEKFYYPNVESIVNSIKDNIEF